MPKVTTYEGKINPSRHIRHYRKIMSLWSHHDALMCRVFPSTLGGINLKWFEKITPRSISTFRELAEQFRDRFIKSSKVVKEMDLLISLKKKKGETLKKSTQTYW